ncbi:MAG: ribbon-helix-helix domain-containing protein [Rhodospirillales bacterium]|nr:ribbon-helix-helix domain-containing protein [Rhodospirillales bacterium]
MPHSTAVSTPHRYPGAAPARHDSTLLNRNVWIGRRRTSLRLEPTMWQALEEVARNSDLTIHQVCTLIDERRQESSLTAAVRVFLLSYYRDAVRAGCQDLGKTLLYRALRA